MELRVKSSFLVVLLLMHLFAFITTSPLSKSNSEIQIFPDNHRLEIPEQRISEWSNDDSWWTWTSLDLDRNNIHDSIQQERGNVWIGLSYSKEITKKNKDDVKSLGFPIRLELPSINALLLGEANPSDALNLSKLEGVVMVERYGVVEFFGDIQTPAVKARNSSYYPGAWDLGFSGSGVNIALTDTGVDNEHPGLVGKFVAGYDAVCYNPSDPNCVLAGFGIRPTDGTFDPDDGNQHGTACMGMASATGYESDGTLSNFTGPAPDAKLVDVRIGTDVGAGPFENYLLEQDFYESALNGIQWIIDHKDDEWQGASEEDFGIDIISLSWGITSHENGGSDGTDMHSRILDNAMEEGITVSNAAGNDGPDNDGLSGMSASSLSITVASTDDQNTIDRSDDTIASYSSRGPRRDNGDNNPFNELIPELSAPGSNIIQAEGCVSEGGCNNFLGGDASDNTYTGRGSGTSYATPAVTGIIALIIEANENLTPIQIKEILKQTSERAGEPTFPEIDPYWNRDFGYGMVDAYEAVKLAQFLANNSEYTNFDINIQNHLLELINSNGSINVTGHSWGQMGVIEKVEFRIDSGNWMEATYSSDFTEVDSLEPINWHVFLDPNELSEGTHQVEVRAISGTSQSLPVVVQVAGFGISKDSNSFSLIIISILSVSALLGVALLVFSKIRSKNQEEIDIIDAELI